MLRNLCTTKRTAAFPGSWVCSVRWRMKLFAISMPETMKKKCTPNQPHLSEICRARPPAGASNLAWYRKIHKVKKNFSTSS